MMNLRRTLSLIPAVLLAAVGHAQSGPAQDLPPVVPLHKMKAGQWVEKVWGDPEKPGEVFAIRIHNDAGYIAMPHVHPMDEHVVVVQGAWWFGMGSRFEASALKEVKLGDFTIGPRTCRILDGRKLKPPFMCTGLDHSVRRLLIPYMN
jgi:hypothetical protein